MLEPHGRALLFDILKPPDDHTLDLAIATTYTLDLLALMTAPVAFSLFDVDDHQELLDRDSITLLESLRRYADKLTVFCHAGLIGLPKAQFPQFEFLERSVIECRPGRDRAAFHSKLWVLRFVTGSGGVTYRVACLTRNLTFDRCWDMAVTLEGPLVDRQRAIAANHPLGDFVRAMPGMAVRAVHQSVVQRIAQVEAEVRRVAFVPPEGFESYAFHAVGLNEEAATPFADAPGRMLVIAPFVSEAGLRRIVSDRPGTLLISRPESLAALNARPSEIERAYVLSQGTEDESETDGDSAPAFDTTRGLHAKCYVIDDGWKSHIFTGSLNATDAALNGNLEFLVELVGAKSRVGIDSLFRREEGKTCFGDLLEEFNAEVTPIDEVEEGIRAAIESAREAIVAAQFVATVVPDDGGFALQLRRQATLQAWGSHVGVMCWPVTCGKGYAVALAPSDTEVVFRGLSLEALTAFLAFEVTVGEPARSEVFVLNLPLEGAPDDRRGRLLRSFIKDRRRLLRFLLFLLADDADLSLVMGPGDEKGAGEGAWGSGAGSGALLESLLRTLHRTPGRLDSVARLIEDLRRDPEGQALLPPMFEQVWNPIWAARQASKS